MIDLLIADDHEFIRAGLRAILEKAGDINVCAEAGDGHQVLQHLRTHEVDLVVLDMSMPGPSGLALIKRIKADWPGVKMLILTMHTHTQYAVRALHAGAAGFLVKTSASDELLAAVRKVAAGRSYISTEVAEVLAQQRHSPLEQPHTALSDREYQVFQMLVGGKSVGDVAAALSISVKTASTHKANILEKMSMKSVAELTRYAVTHDLASPGDTAPE